MIETIKNHIEQLNEKDAEIKRLEAEVERMKCCGNCSHLGLENKHILFCGNDMYPFPITGKCDKWEDRK